MPEKISLALGGAKKLPKPAPTNGVKRSNAALREDEDEGHDDGKAQTVSHFDKAAGGAIDEDNRQRDTGPLVIAPQANRDWKEAGKRKRQRNGLPAGAQNDEQNVSEAAVSGLEASKPAFGLNVTQRDNDGEDPIINGHDIQAEAEVAQQRPPEANGKTTAKQKTDDELAMDALLGKITKSELVLPAVTEEEAFERDYHEAPDMASLDDYARVPVEQFGAALLRGMGWKEGQGIGSQKGMKVVKTKVPERRPALLGIGAKEEAAVAQEMGTWGRAAKRGGEVKVYNPVLLRDKQTGETYTEEELQKKRELDERRKYEEEFERTERELERKRRREDEDGSRKEDRDLDRGRRRRQKDYDDSRDRRRNKEHVQGRDSQRHDDSDDEYYRRKEKECRRRERDREDGYHDRERFKRHDSGRERHGDQERDRRR